MNPGGIHHLHTLFSSCEAELEELMVHENEQRRTRKQVLILSPSKPTSKRVQQRHFHIELLRKTNTSTNKSSCASVWFVKENDITTVTQIEKFA